VTTVLLSSGVNAKPPLLTVKTLPVMDPPDQDGVPDVGAETCVTIVVDWAVVVDWTKMVAGPTWKSVPKTVTRLPGETLVGYSVTI
jgi:hypothetical protein